MKKLTISKRSKSSQIRHDNNECKDIINNRIQEFIDHHSPR